MIARVWHGVTMQDKADAFWAYINETGLPGLQATAGNRGVYVLRRPEGNKVHFVMMSLWDSRDAITRFAGAEIEKARYYPKDREFLLELETTVKHYAVLAAPAERNPEGSAG
jgi:heme-degrading monooxygenase HmoA